MKKIVILGLLLLFFIVFFLNIKLWYLIYFKLKNCFFSNTPVFWDKCGCISKFFKFFCMGFFLSFLIFKNVFLIGFRLLKFNKNFF